MNGPLKYPGGKHYLASKIVALMPPHLHYVEPYAGGLAVLLAKNPEGVSEVVNDIDGDLTNFWHVLQESDSFHKFRRVCEAIPFSESEWDQSKKDRVFGDNADRAISFFVRCRQSLAGRKDAFASISKTRTRRGMNEQASAWLSAVECLPEVHARLKRVAILNRDALEVIRQQDGEETLFYLDPPYLHETRSTTGEYGDFEMSRDQHREMLELLVSIKGKFLLSGYSSALYESAARRNRWGRRTFELPNNAAGGDAKRRMTECVWYNF